MSPGPAFEQAVERLRQPDDVKVRDGLEYQAIVAARDEVIGRYGPVFSPGAIDQLSEDDFTSFLFFEHNKHWTGLHRLGRQATKDMAKLRAGLKMLLDESRPLVSRFDDAIAAVYGMGKALASAILLVAYPDRYGVWNGVSEAALKKLELWSSVGPGTTGQQYERVNRILLELAGALDQDLWTLDAQLWALVTNGAGPDGDLAAPFDGVFADRAEADAAFDLLGSVLSALNINTNADKRFAVTFSPSSRALTLDYGSWCIARFRPPAQPLRIELALLDQDSRADSLHLKYRFKEGPKESPVVLRSMEWASLTSDVRALLLETARVAVATYGHRDSSNWRKYHIDALGEALLDPDKRDALLTAGLTPGPRSEPPTEETEHVAAGDGAFTAEARDLLVAMTADPTKDFYVRHKEALTRCVQEPLQRILRDVATKVEPQLRELLETEKRLFGVFIKNDFGQGGAWPWYWGAFYPKGGKRSEGSQLYVSIDESGFSYGFSIGDYASEDRKRFVKGAGQHREALIAALSDTVNVPHFEFGKENESLHATPVSAEGLDLAAWLEQVGETGPQVYVTVPWDELLDLGHERLVEDATYALNRLFPLVLLATAAEPMPAIRAYLEGQTEETYVNPPYSLEDLVAETSLSRDLLKRWIRAIARKKQAVIYGPPGTGKTFVAELLAKHLVAGGSGEVQTVQFHPAYVYEDFIQGIRPRARDEGGLDYPVVPGRFLQFCETARSLKGTSVLIIDEINRANLARVFGELMYLLEYRDKSVPLAAGGLPFSIPDNVRIIGTMNTADRSIALVDHALRRRFAFLELRPDYEVLRRFHAETDFDPSGLITVLNRLNARIADHHYEVGISFFLCDDLLAQLPDIWEMEIEPYLTEYFFDRPDAVEEYRWQKIADAVLKA